MTDVRQNAKNDARTLAAIRALSPTYPQRRRTLRDIVFRHDDSRCCYCGRYSTHRRIVVQPVALQRRYFHLCSRQACVMRLLEWSACANARRLRAQFDWEAENPTAAAADLIGYIPPQYPSISRATLRAFLDSGANDATIADDSKIGVEQMNGSIRVLGFYNEVYAEQRSGQTVLRRIRERP